MNESHSDTTSEIANKLLSSSGSPQIITVTISQFREVYNEVESNARATPVDILLNGDWAMAQFSRLCNHRLIITSDPPPKYLALFIKRKVLTEKDFAFASLYSKVYGSRQYLYTSAFLKEEVSTNWLPILLTLIISFISFRVLISAPNGIKSIEKIIELVVTAATLFLSIFILFTVSQNAELIKDPYLFRKGLTHRFFRVDKLITSLAFIGFLISILTLVMINLPTTVTIFGKSLIMPDAKIVVPIFSAVSISILVDCFLALINYYLERVRYVFEKDLAKELFDERWSHFKEFQNSSDPDTDDDY